MEKSQLDNLIRFCFNFHQTMDCDWTMQHPSYISEKWDKYIGFEPNKLELYPSNPQITKWLKIWNVSNEDWEELKEIVTFIQIINMKALTLPGGNDSNIFAQWSPSELLDEFERFIGDKNKINKDEYKGLHELVDREIGYWLWQTDNKRDYNLNLLV
jgi:hypothetical protein